ncbi:MAG: NADP-dependent oxidoreductase [Candidatus Brocadiia bacterium]
MTEVNRQIRLASRPVGAPEESNFELVEGEMPEPETGQVLVKTRFLSVDPYMRGRIGRGSSYAESVPVGDVMIGGAVGTVTESRCEEFETGDVVLGHWGWQEYAACDCGDLREVDPSLAPISTALGVLGMPGMTAYFGLLEIGQPREGETVFVSGAAGAVGSTVGQIAKIQGCRVAGSAGSPEKIEWLVEELGYDDAFNYKESTNLRRAVRRVCPDGVDVYFDNVGGPLTDAVFRCLNTNARIAVCGQISQYNATEQPTGPRKLWQLIVNQARAEGFLVYQFEDRFPEALRQMAEWIQEDKLAYRETITDGIENAPAAFIGLFQGENIGKQLVRVVEE